MHSDPNLEILMARYQDGDSAAASALVDHVSPQLFRFFAAQISSRAEADDLLQETWLRVHKVRHTYRTGEPAMPWFYAIAHHIRVDHYRKAVRSAAGERRLMESQEAATMPNDARPMEEVAILLAPLSASQREVLEMLKVAGMSLEEVARATSSSVGSVKQKVHRAYKRLRKAASAVRVKAGERGGRR
jgi:RNA polymerase sigma-70 factor (ECF subfamily)